MKNIDAEIAEFINEAEPHIGTEAESDLFLNLKGEEREDDAHEDK